MLFLWLLTWSFCFLGRLRGGSSAWLIGKLMFGFLYCFVCSLAMGLVVIPRNCFRVIAGTLRITPPPPNSGKAEMAGRQELSLSYPVVISIFPPCWCHSLRLASPLRRSRHTSRQPTRCNIYRCCNSQLVKPQFFSRSMFFCVFIHSPRAPALPR